MSACRFNDRLHECTRKTLYQICQALIPQNWNANEKTFKQKLKRKAASTAKKMQDSTMDDSIELHAPEDSLCGPNEKSHKSDGSTRQKSQSSKSSAMGTYSSSVQSKVVLPPVPLVLRGWMAIDTSQEMNTCIEIITTVPNGVEPSGASQNAAIHSTP